MGSRHMNWNKNPIIDFFSDYIKAIKSFHKQTKPDSKILEAYNKWIITKDEYNYYIRSNHPYHLMKKQKSSSSYIILAFFWVALLWYYFMYMPIKSYITVDDFSTMGDPIQIPTSWSTTQIIEWENIEISFLAEYILSWRVLATNQYWENIFERLLWSRRIEDSILRNKDVWIWRWFLTQDDYVNRFIWKSYFRWLIRESRSYKDRQYVTQKYTSYDVQTHASHNHLIPADNKVKKLLRWIKKWQYVQISGYLVSLKWDKWYNLTSSLTREDTWDWACETIYVTDVKWLKEK